MIRLALAFFTAKLMLLSGGLTQVALSAGPVELDDVAVPLVKSDPRSEAERDRLDAVSMFAAGRMHEQRQELPEALRRYQRAFRLDPTAEPVLREIIPLAFNLGREEEAVRYATKLAELDASDSNLLRRLGIVLTEQRQFKVAIALYEKVRKLDAGQPNSASQVMLHLELGRLYLLTEQYEKASELFVFVSKALDAPDEYGLKPVVLKSLVGDKGELHELMAAGFLETGNVDEAAKSFARLEKVNPNQAVAAYNQARIAAKAGRHEEALGKLEEYFDARESSKGTAPFELFAKLLRETKQADKLIPRLEEMLAAQEGNVSLNFALGEEYFEQKQWEKASARYEVVLASQPAAEVYRRLTAIYHRTAQDQKLVELLGQVVDRSGSLEVVEEQIKPLVEDKGRIEGVLQLAREKFADAKPENHDALEAAGLLALQAKLYERAGELFELAIKSKPTEKAQVLLRYGLELFLADRFNDAARIFQRGIDEKLLPESNPAFYFYLAGALAMDGKTDEALAAAITAAEKKPDDPRFGSRIAWVYYHAKRYDAAVEHYRELLKKYGANYDSPEVRSVVHDTRLILSNIAVLQGKLAEAEEWIEQVLDEFPDDVGALNDLGYLWADQNKRLERAQRMIRQAVDAEPENAAYRDSLGWVLYRLGQFEEAALEQQKAIELSKAEDQESDGVMYDHMGDIYAALGQIDKANTAWREAAAAFEKSGENDKLETVRKKLNDE
jgi:tetratricopeptide (TPR) repeat protein